MLKRAIAMAMGMLCMSAVVAAEQTHYTNTALVATRLTNASNTVNGIRSPLVADSKYTHMPRAQQEKLARIFDLKPKEYTQYLHYMNDSIDGFEYQLSTNPNLVLASHSLKNPVKYRRYIENAIREDHDAIGRFLRVSSDYTTFARALYPNEKPIATPKTIAGGGLREGDVLQLFCRLGDPTCSEILGKIKGPVLKTSGARLDIFAVGEHVSKSAIIKFAKANQISPGVVRARKITLNFGQNALSRLKKSTKGQVSLPVIMLRRNGIEMSLSHLGGENNA